MFKRKYRIVEKTRANGKVEYHVQVKTYLWFSWFATWHPETSYTSSNPWKAAIFNNLEAAIVYKEKKESLWLAHRKDEQARKIVKERVVR